MSYPPLPIHGWRQRARRVLEAERDKMVEKGRDVEAKPDVRRAALENANAMHYALDVIEHEPAPPEPVASPEPATGERGYKPDVTIPTDVAFGVMEALRFAAMYLAPPEDWKPEKFDPPEVYAGEIADHYRKLQRAIARDWGVEDEVFPHGA